MDKRWTLKQPGDSEKVNQLAESLNVNRVIANLLVQRGINNFEEARVFFRPQLSDLHDPFLMTDMDKAINRLDIAMKNNERIMVYGDYDVDGTTSVALVYSFLKKRHKNLDFYIPNRYEEGYGVSLKGIDYASTSGVSLIIALDCGIKAVEKIEYASKRDIDFVICDHHTPGEFLPKAVAILDPKRLDCNYPDRNLSGCGVGFKLIQAYCRQNKINEEEVYEYLDLVAVSIASDIVPITGENRIMAFYGLQKLNTTPSTGLLSIIKIAGMEGRELTISDIVFKIGPRINAAGRIDSGNDAVDLLVSSEPLEAKQMSEDIDVSNNTRKDLDRTITQEALDMLSSSPELANRKSTVLFKPDWHKGVVGIVASRLTEHYYRPTIVLTQSKGLATGSARSVEGFDLYKAIESCSDLLENFGGHMYAAGLTLKPERVPEFIRRFEKIVSETILPEQLVPQIEIDDEIHLKDIDERFNRILKQFKPFGPGNMKPVFATRRVFDYGTSKAVGKDKDHLKVELIEEHSAAIKPGVAFQMSHFLDQVKQGKPFDVCYCVDENVFNGLTSLQMTIRDLLFPYQLE